MYIIFIINNQYYAFSESYLKRFSVPLSSIEAPSDKENILGLCIYDSVIYSVINTYKILGFEEKPISEKSVYILIDCEDNHIILPVDEVVGLTDSIYLDEALVDSCKYTNAIFRDNEKVGIVLDIKELCKSCL